MATPKFSTLYDHHDGPAISEFSPSKTKQEFLEESDINNIVNQYEHDGIVMPEGDRQPMYGDFTAPELQDYQQALNIIDSANTLFQGLNARVRERFHNDAAELLLFVQDPANRNEAIELGIIDPDRKSPVGPPTPPNVAPAPTPTPPTGATK